MNDETYEALKRIMSGRYGKTSLQHEADTQAVKDWIEETAKEHNLCPKYGGTVLPDENGMCSLCGEHKADRGDNSAKTDCEKYGCSKEKGHFCIPF